MELSKFVEIAQMVSSFAMVASVIYLAKQIYENRTTAKMQFGFNLTDRLYQRYFKSAQDENFSKLLSRNWKEENFENYEYMRMMLWYNTCLVDLFDCYDQWKNGVVDKHHLDMRMNAISSGMLKTRIGLNCWNFWKQSRDEKFIKWFELEVFGGKPEDESYVQNTDNLNVFRD